ncbi:MAG: MerR family transcriptional regulator [Tidjanibacter sp.]|nr:MerR family transcriptional regulator [Tidjanibacter sp.]
MEEIVHPKGKIYYSMGEVCDLFGVNASLLRFWESEFPILKIAKNSRGHRIYTPADVDNLRLIYHLVKEKGMTLEGAKKRIRQNKDGENHEAEIIERLRGIRNMLAALREELGDEVEVIEIDEEATEEAPAVEAKAEVEVEVTPEPEPIPEPAPKAEQLADFKMEMPSTEPQPIEEPKKARTPKMGTLIGGDLFSPEDIRLAVAKKNSKEAKRTVVEQTLFDF